MTQLQALRVHAFRASPTPSELLLLIKLQLQAFQPRLLLLAPGHLVLGALPSPRLDFAQLTVLIKAQLHVKSLA